MRITNTGRGKLVYGRWLPVLVLLAIGVAEPAEATLWGPLNGYADLSAVQAKVDGVERDSFREDYNVSVEKRLAPWVDMRLAYRLFRFDQAFEFDPGSYRKEMQPSAELRWQHPLFQISGSAVRREVETQGQGTVITNTTQGLLKSKSTNYPIMELRFDEQHSYFAELRDERDIRNRRIQAAANLNREQNTYTYTFTHDVTENVVSEQTSRGDRHLARWRGQSRAHDGRMRLAGNYSFSHSDQTTVNNAGGPVLRVLASVVGLYAQSTTADLVTLQERPGLADGSTTEVTLPEIDLGSANVDHNLGLDLGSRRPIGALYIYTDRPSGEQVDWQIWSSEDNLTWTLRITAPQQVFNAALNRYELYFDVVNGRYIKAVNSGFNEVAQVFATELVVFEQMSDHPELGVSSLSHHLDGRIDYRFNDRWRGSFDLSMQADENPGRDGDRTRGAASARASYLVSPVVSHHFSWQLSNQWYESTTADVLENMSSYTLAVTPLATFRGSASLSDRITWLSGESAQRNTSSAVEATTELLTGLTMNCGGGLSLLDNKLSGSDFRSWNMRGRLEAELNDAIDVSLDATYFETLETNTDNLRVRNIYGLGLDYRLTQTLFARVTVRDTREESDRFSVDGLITWNMLPSLRISAQHYELGVAEVVTSLRQSINLNWELSRRANFYLRLAKVDLSGSGGSLTTSFQQGFRLGF